MALISVFWNWFFNSGKPQKSQAAFVLFQKLHLQNIYSMFAVRSIDPSGNLNIVPNNHSVDLVLLVTSGLGIFLGENTPYFAWLVRDYHGMVGQIPPHLERVLISDSFNTSMNPFYKSLSVSTDCRYKLFSFGSLLTFCSN